MVGTMDRSDFDEIYDRAGPDGLNEALRERLGDSPRLDRELQRMARSGKWVVAWDDETGEGCIVGRA